jgi:O-antigen/teichoic acid export membrane protein
MRPTQITLKEPAGASGMPSLARLAVRGGMVTGIGQVCKVLLQLASTLILARLLSPTDFGKVAMVGSLLGFILLFKDVGLSTATIQYRSITSDQVSALFWLNLLFGTAVGFVLALSAPLVATFYNDESLSPIVFAFAVIAPLSCLGTQHLAILQREMRFTSLTVRTVASGFLGLSAAILAAKFGFGYWALLINEGVSTCVSVALLWSSSSWRPSRPKSTPGIGPLLRFGGGLATGNILAYLNHNLDSILLGRYYGEGAVGIYTRAHMLFERPLSNVLPPMMGVALPVFSRLKGDDARFQSVALKATQLMCLLGCWVVMIITPCSDWLVSVLLGRQWSAAAPIASVLGLFVVVEPLANLVGVLLIASGRSKEMAIWRGVTLVVAATGFLVGVRWGPMGVAVAYTTTGIITRVWLVFYAARTISIPVRLFFGSSWPFLLVAILVGLSVWNARDLIGTTTPMLALLIFVPAATLLYFGLLYLLPTSRGFINGLGDLLANFKRQNPSPAQELPL